MAEWEHELDLRDVWRDSASSFEESRDFIVERIRRTVFYAEAGGDLVNIVDDLAASQDEDEFNMVWNDFYDWADEARVWIATL